MNAAARTRGLVPANQCFVLSAEIYGGCKTAKYVRLRGVRGDAAGGIITPSDFRYPENLRGWGGDARGSDDASLDSRVGTDLRGPPHRCAGIWPVMYGFGRGIVTHLMVSPGLIVTVGGLTIVNLPSRLRTASVARETLFLGTLKWLRPGDRRTIENRDCYPFWRVSIMMPTPILAPMWGCLKHGRRFFLYG